MGAIVALADGSDDDGRERAIADGARELSGLPANAILFSDDATIVADEAGSVVFALRENTKEVRRLFLHALARFAVVGAFFVPKSDARALAGVAAAAPQSNLAFAHIELGDRVLGTIVLACDERDDDLLAALRAYADAVARSIGAGRAVSDSQRETRDLRVLALVDDRMRRAGDITELQYVICEALCEGLGALRCAIFERSGADSSRARTVAAAGGGLSRLPAEVRLRMEAESIAKALGTPRAIAVPLAREGRGELILAAGFEDSVDDVAPTMRVIAAHVSLALANMQLYERERKRRARAESLERISRVLRDTQPVDEVLLAFAIAVSHELPLDCIAYARVGDLFVRRAAHMRDGRPLEAARTIPVRELGAYIATDEPADAPVLSAALRSQVLSNRPGVLVPLHVGGSAWGALVLIEDAGGEVWQSSERVTFFRSLGAHLELSLGSALAFDREQRRAQERATLAEAARTILGFTTLRQLADAMCRLASELVGAPRACAAQSVGDRFEVIGAYGDDAESLAEQFAERRKRLASADDRMSGDRRRVRVAEGEGYVAVPLARTSGETGEPEAVDAYLIVSSPSERFGRDAMRLLQELGALFALRVRNLQLYDDSTRMNAALRESSEFKDDLIAMLAHDFKGPLTVVLGYCELLLETAGSASEEVEMIFSQTQRLVRLCDDALVLAQTQSEGFSLARQIVNFGPFVRECIDETAPSFARVTLSITDEPLAVHVDPQRFSHVIDNLLSNALKYSKGSVEVVVRRDGDRAIFEVSDSGIGIPAHELQAVFTRFGRATNARQLGVAGTGVGLYVSRKIVDVHRGTLSVESREGVGSKFTIALPLVPHTPPTSVAL